MERHCRIGLAALVALVLAGCASTGPAPVEDRSVSPRPPPPKAAAPAPPPASSRGTYRVQRGDTLYSIAFRNGVDYRDLAAWNGIEPPYTIYPGRELRLSPVSSRPAVAAAPPRKPPPVAASAAPRPATPPPAAPASQAAKPPPETVAAAPPPAQPAAPPPKPEPPAAAPVASGDVAWRWPADGAVVGGYAAGDPMKQGIDIAGQSGAPVRAAADGTVVYSGNGLIGYGELIIVKHSPAFLSAYGHNRKRLVKEGDAVKGGQVIAEMGANGGRDELHFEIRKNGKPINPMDYLPRR